MGTNYYAHHEACPTCGREEIIHIGKSSAGWYFSLHVTDELPDFTTWLQFLTTHPVEIRDEYDQIIPLADMIQKIINRNATNDEPKNPQFLDPNMHYDTVRNLFAHSRRHLTLPISYIEGEFS